MSTTTYSQAKALAEDLADAPGPISWQIGKIINALVEAAKKEQPDNIALQQLDPLQPSANGDFITGLGGSDVRAIVGQIVAATKPPRSVGIA